MLENSILKAIHEDSVGELRKYISELESILLTANPPTQEFLNFFNDLLIEKRFLDLGGAIYLIVVFQNVWEKVSEKQIIKYLPVLRNAHSKFDDLDLAFIEELIFQKSLCGVGIPISDCILALDLRTGSQQYYSEDDFKLIFKMLEEPKFLELTEAEDLLMIIKINWKKISVSQKQQLLPKLENAYGKFNNWMARFWISELLGEYFADEQAFQALCRLRVLEVEDFRALIPHGLEHIIKDSGDEELSKKAYGVLLQMRGDSSAQVRDEVEESLQQLTIHGIEMD